MKKLIILVMALLVLASCEELTELNKDVKNPQEVPSGSLFANATVAMFDRMASPNVNENALRLWAQQWAQTTYADESNYELVERNINGRFWNTLYATVMTDSRAARADVPSEAETNLWTPAQVASQQAAMEILEILAMHTLVDVFGDLPYSEAFDSDATVTPGYDDDKDIYDDLITRLDAAIGNLGSGDNGMGSYDLIYGGSADQWKKMANSLKLRLAIRIADVNPTKAKAMAEAAAPGVFTSSADDYTLPFQGSTPNTNPLWEDLVQSGRSDFVACGTMVDMMKALNDPRIDDFFKDMYEVTDPNGNVTMEFLGGVYGDNNSFNALSHPGARQLDPTHPGYILTYTEVRFLLADAAARGWDVGGTAEEHYNAAITNSILDWGGSAQEAADYLAQADVAYSTAAGDWKEKIGTQKWLALYDQGFEAWTSYRMYDAPVLPIAAQAGIPTPTRYTYPVTEYSLNENSVEAAAAAIGGDNLDTKVFWDVN